MGRTVDFAEMAKKLARVSDAATVWVEALGAHIRGTSDAVLVLNHLNTNLQDLKEEIQGVLARATSLPFEVPPYQLKGVGGRG